MNLVVRGHSEKLLTLILVPTFQSLHLVLWQHPCLKHPQLFVFYQNQFYWLSLWTHTEKLNLLFMSLDRLQLHWFVGGIWLWRCSFSFPCPLDVVNKCPVFFPSTCFLLSLQHTHSNSWCYIFLYTDHFSYV